MTTLALPSALDLFETRPLNTAVEQCQFLEVKATTSLENSTLEFYYPGILGTYVDLSQTLLHLRVKVTKDDNSVLDQDSFVTTCNGFLHSIFSRIEVSLNDTVVSTGHHYPFKAYLQNLLNYSESVKSGYLRTEMFYVDGNCDVTFQKNLPHSGMNRRKDKLANSKTVELLGRVHTNFFHQEKYLLDLVNIRMVLHKSDPEFALISDIPGAKFKIKFDHASLFLKTVRVAPSVRLGHSTVLALNRPATYEFNDLIVKNLVIPAGLTSFSKSNLYPARIPERLTVALCPSTSFHGTYNQNPFNFKHFKTSYLAFTVNGTLVPSLAYQPKFTDNIFLRNYLSVFQASGNYGENKQIFTSLETYKDGYFITSQDLSPDHSSRKEMTQTGDVSIEIRFEDALTEAVTLVLFSENTSELQITNNRVVTVYPPAS